jgi:hypothetical protein
MYEYRVCYIRISDNKEYDNEVYNFTQAQQWIKKWCDGKNIYPTARIERREVKYSKWETVNVSSGEVTAEKGN